MKHLQPFDTIQTLDPIQDHCQICRLSVGYEFAWETTRALEYALLRTFCAPSVSRLLQQTQEFTHRPQKRYDDTGFIVTKILQWGYDTPEGATAIDRMNRMHRRFAIANEDFLYVLSTFIYEPIRWNARFGWRPYCETEKLALYYFWRAVGERMGIQSIPETYEAFERYNCNYEAQHLRYSEANQHIGDAVLQMMTNWFPRWTRSLVKSNTYALLDDAMLNALGWPQPTPRQRQRVVWAMKTRQRLVRRLWPRRRDSFTDYYQRLRSYPNGADWQNIGPPGQLSALNQTQPMKGATQGGSRCPFHRLMQITQHSS
ncbi:MAG: oxygenase MpaB family protein [Cyanobacteria bacterium J06635_15]